jgi:hypothetical protein
MATLQATSITGTLTVDGTVIGGGKTLQYQEFTTSGTFTPTSAAIAAGGVHQVFLVGGGQRGASANEGGCGGEIIEKFVTLTSTTGCAVTIGAGGTTNGGAGGNSSVAFNSAGGVAVTALGGSGGKNPSSRLTSGAGGYYSSSTPAATIPAATIVITINPSRLDLAPARSHGWQSAYAYGYQFAYQSAYAAATGAGPGYKGYGAGGASTASGINSPKVNSGSGSKTGVNAASGYCLITWFEE